MQTTLLAGVAAFGLAVAAPAAFAANADNPYGNVDRRNDAGNDTGDSRVEKLNDNQLNRNYQGSVEPRAPSGQGTTSPAPTTAAPGTMPGSRSNVATVPQEPR